MANPYKWFVILNPISGFGRSLKKWKAIEQELSAQGIDYDYAMTTSDKLGGTIAAEALAQGYRRLISVGGDGNLHDIVNGVMTQQSVKTTDVTLAMISLGTGNDWIKTSGISSDYRVAISQIKAGNTYLQNIGVAQSIMNGVATTRYFHNFAGVGFDAYVVNRTASLKPFGQMAYLFGLVRSLFSYELPLLRITCDGETIETHCYLALSGIGQYGGGGMRLTPGANPIGKGLYVAIAMNLGKLEVIRNILKLYDGSFIALDQVKTFENVQKVTIEVIQNSQPVYMEADGDEQGMGPFEVSIIPRAINMIVP